MLSLNNRVNQALINFVKQRFNLNVDDFSASKYLKNTTIPGLIAHDIEDTVVLFEEGKKIAKSWKTAQFIETKGLGHSMHDNYLYQTIVQFIEA
jgi:pimeloyl-ACP methyl ester carboxylesterase